MRRFLSGKRSSLPSPITNAISLAWLGAVIAVALFLVYKLADLHEPFAFGHARWADAYAYIFARAHLDFGLSRTFGLNVENVTLSGEPIFYLSGPPLGGLLQALIVNLLGGEFWTIRVLPLLFTLVNVWLIALLVRRNSTGVTAPLAIMLVLGMPFVLEYGSSNEGLQGFAIAAGLAGYLSYMRFLSNTHWASLLISAICFALGMGFNWLSGFMAMAMLAHLWLQPLSLRTKVIASALTGVALSFVVFILLIQQGMATGEFLYPFKRALQRVGAAQDVVGWGELIELQLRRYWGYFGPVVSVLSLYWLLRRIFPKPNWGPRDTLAILIWVPGLVYGFLLRDAAYHHDFLLLGFLPGAAFMSTMGLLMLITDLDQAKVRPWKQRLAGVVVVLLLGLHAVGAVRSAQNFERQEQQDLVEGGARLAWHLKDMPVGIPLVADRSVVIGLRVDRLTKEQYGSLWPFIDYLVRRPVRIVQNMEDLRGLLCKGKGGILIQESRSAESAGKRIQVPTEWVAKRSEFDWILVHHLNTRPPPGCFYSSD